VKVSPVPADLSSDMPHHIFDTPEMKPSEKRAQLRKWLTKPGVSLSLPSTRRASFFDYRDGTVDIVIFDHWSIDTGTESDAYSYDLVTAVCPITLKEKRSIRRFWWGGGSRRLNENVMLGEVKTDGFWNNNEARRKRNEEVAAEARKYIGGLLRRKSCEHRHNINLIHVTRPFPKRLFRLYDLEA
jgi:hypothetical protein